MTHHRARNRTVRHRAAAVLAVAAVAAGGLAAAPSASAAVPPPADRTSTGVTADGLPTVQIDGVVWSQAVVGNTVYAGGSFANARPAGAAAGTNLTPRANLLSYDITTGVLNTAFAPSLNGQVKVVAASPDGSRIYVGGAFTTANGQNRYRLAAYDVATGALVPGFHPTLDATVNTLAVTATTVYAGGVFGTANGVSRTRLAAFDATNGALLNWAPKADNAVDALLLTPDGSRVVVGGAFTHLNSTTATGIGAVSATTGVPQSSYAVNTVVRDSGANSAILSLSTDGTSVFGTGYVYQTGGNFEGAFSIVPNTGAINWLADCHGDTYGTFASGPQVYLVSHNHYCANIGSFPDNATETNYHFSTAVTTAATGTVQHNGQTSAPHYQDFYGKPSPSQINWYPILDAGSYTKQYQAAWSVTGTSQYVVEGGEFPHVNGVGQQGLVRFAIPSLAPDKRGPQDTSTSTAPTVTRTGSTAAVSWPTNWDQDNLSLTYHLYRDDNLSTPVYSTTAQSTFWNRPRLLYTDSGLVAGKTYLYWIKAVDASGNVLRSANTTVTG